MDSKKRLDSTLLTQCRNLGRVQAIPCLFTTAWHSLKPGTWNRCCSFLGWNEHLVSQENCSSSFECLPFPCGMRPEWFPSRQLIWQCFHSCSFSSFQSCFSVDNWSQNEHRMVKQLPGFVFYFSQILGQRFMFGNGREILTRNYARNTCVCVYLDLSAILMCVLQIVTRWIIIFTRAFISLISSQ